MGVLKLTRRSENGATGKGIIEENNKMLSVAYNTLKFENSLVKSGGKKVFTIGKTIRGIGINQIKKNVATILQKQRREHNGAKQRFKIHRGVIVKCGNAVERKQRGKRD